MTTTASLPYAGTSGWSGSDTSRERALDQDADGTTAERQQQVLDFLNTRAHTGATWREVARALGLHHGKVSGALSALHKDNRVSRLKYPRRERCKVYVALGFEAGRETEPQGRESRLTDDERTRIEVLRETTRVTAEDVDWLLEIVERLT